MISVGKELRLEEALSSAIPTILSAVQNMTLKFIENCPLANYCIVYSTKPIEVAFSCLIGFLYGKYHHQDHFRFTQTPFIFFLMLTIYSLC